MLFRKTFRNALATLLGMALALATGAAHAVIDLDATGMEPVGTVSVATETLSSQGNDAGRTAGYYDIHLSGANSALFRVNGEVGIRGATGRTLYIRYDLTNMVFQRNTSESGTPTAGTVRIADSNDDGTTDTGGDIVNLRKEAGGTSNATYVVYAAEADATIDPEAEVSAYLHNELAIRSNATGTISQRVYLDLNDALSGPEGGDNHVSGTLKSANVVVLAASSLDTDVSRAESVTATVASGFTALSGSLLGQVEIKLIDPAPRNAGQGAADSGDAVAAIGDVAKVDAGGSVMTFTGDFSVGNFTATAGAVCGNNALATKNAEGEVLETVAMAGVSTALAALGMTTFCVTAPTNNADAFPEGDYHVAVTYAALDNAVAKPADLAAKRIGGIVRDSSRANIPYLTTFSGYNQRVIIVNRNTADIAYEFNFTTEDGTMAEAGDAAKGMVPGNRTLVLRAADIVTLTGGSPRTAATLEVSATTGAVDVATTQVNQNDGSTDTVLYEVVTGT